MGYQVCIDCGRRIDFVHYDSVNDSDSDAPTMNGPRCRECWVDRHNLKQFKDYDETSSLEAMSKAGNKVKSRYDTYAPLIFAFACGWLIGSGLLFLVLRNIN